MQLLQSAMPIWLLLKWDSSWSLKTSLKLHLAMVVAVVISMPLPSHSCPNWWIVSATLCSLFELWSNDPNLLFTLHNQTYVVLVMKLLMSGGWPLLQGRVFEYFLLLTHVFRHARVTFFVELFWMNVNICGLLKDP